MTAAPPPVATGDRWSLYSGDCLDVLPKLSGCRVRLVLTDPPYMIGASSIGKSTPGSSWADLMNASRWYSQWMNAAIQELRFDGFLAAFCNWRSIPFYTRALSLIDKYWSSCIVWDKEWMGPAGRSAFRKTWEAVLIYAQPQAVIPDRSAADIFRCKWMAKHSGKYGHPAEKPVPLLAWLIEKMTDEGDLVLDCFAGSGSTLEAALSIGRRATGIEIEKRWLDCTVERLRHHQLSLGHKPFIHVKNCDTPDVSKTGSRPALPRREIPEFFSGGSS